MLSQVMLIGVGGSGGKTLRVLRQTLLRRLRRAGWTSNELPIAWQMLWIDSVSHQVADSFPEKLLPNADYLGLVSPGVQWDGTLQALKSAVADHERQPALASWVPTTVPFEISKGAGQYRAVGRGVALNRLDVIKHTLSTKYQEMTSPRAIEELREVARLLQFEAEGNPGAPFAMVVSSVAGGSGAGMFIDVAEALKSVAPTFASNTHAIIYGPDVFGSIPQGMGGGIAPNVLAAVNEITSAVRKEGMDRGSEALFESKSLQGGAGFGIGGRFTYLMGASNGTVSFGTQEDVYRAVGEALSPLVIDEAVQDWLNGFIITNVFANSGDMNLIDDKLGLREASNSQHRQILSSIGFARVGLGMDRFSEYATEVLARESVARLLWPRFEPESKDAKTKPELVSQKVDDEWPEFLDKSGLNERDPANDVVDALAPIDSAARFQNFAGQVVARASQGVSEKGLDPQTWAVRLLGLYNEGLAEVLAAETEARYQRAREWAMTIEARLVRLVTVSATRSGLEVTAKLLEKLRDEVRFVAGTELPSQAAAMRRHLDSMAGRIAQDLQQGLSMIPPNHESIDRARTWLMTGVKIQADAQRHELAANLLADLEANLLTILERAVDESGRALVRDLTTPGPDGMASPFESWPALGDAVPQRLIPGVTEKVLIEATEYPQLLESLTRKSVGQQRADMWKPLLIERTIAGLPLDERGLDATPTLIDMAAPWMPQDARVRWVAEMPAQRAAATLPVRAPEYLDRVRNSVLADDTTALGGFLQQDLVAYLNTPDVAEQGARAVKFTNSLAAALSASRPMASIIPDLLPLVHPGQQVDSYLSSSTIPATLKPLVQPVLDTAGIKAGNAKLNFGDAKPQQIELFQVLQKSYHPTVFRTLMEPIAASWRGVQGDPEKRDSWWTMRRARPLTEALPVTDDILQLMVTGWFVTGLLNLRRTTKEVPSMGPLVEVVDDRGTWLKFPHPLLGFKAESNDHELLPAVLKSLGIALVTVATGSPVSLDPLKPYWRLRDTGTNHRTILADWIRDGQLLPSGVEPRESVAGTSSGLVEQRQSALVASVKASQEYYATLFADLAAHPNDVRIDRVWELRAQVSKALSDIADCVVNLRPVEGERPVV